MKFVCSECAAKYKVPDSRLAGRGSVRMKPRPIFSVTFVVRLKDK